MKVVTGENPQFVVPDRSGGFRLIAAPSPNSGVGKRAGPHAIMVADCDQPVGDRLAAAYLWTLA